MKDKPKHQSTFDYENPCHRAALFMTMGDNTFAYLSFRDICMANRKQGGEVIDSNADLPQFINRVKTMRKENEEQNQR